MSKRNKKALPPRVKRMTRPARLQSAKKWIAGYDGKNLLRGYCRHFAVDWRCAAIELAMLGVKQDPEYLQQREAGEAQLISHRRATKEKLREPERSDRWYDYDSMVETYSACDFEAFTCTPTSPAAARTRFRFPSAVV